MIVSHRHKMIFVRTRKTAGTSVAVSLYRYLGPTDIAVGSWREALHLGIRPNYRMRIWARSAGFDRVPGQSRTESRAERVDKAIKARGMRYFSSDPKIKHHFSVSDIVRRLPQHWEDYFTIAIVRNPYDRVLSDYAWRTRKLGASERPSLVRYLLALQSGDELGGLISNRHDQLSQLSLDGRVAVDQVIRYETLNEDLKRSLIDTTIQWDGWLPELRHSAEFGIQKPAHSNATIELVSKIYEDELVAFCYDPPGV